MSHLSKYMKCDINQTRYYGLPMFNLHKTPSNFHFGISAIEVQPAFDDCYPIYIEMNTNINWQ